MIQAQSQFRGINVLSLATTSLANATTTRNAPHATLDKRLIDRMYAACAHFGLDDIISANAVLLWQRLCAHGARRERDFANAAASKTTTAACILLSAKYLESSGTKTRLSVHSLAVYACITLQQLVAEERRLCFAVLGERDSLFFDCKQFACNRWCN
jgi:hypothetical protein